MAHVGLITLRTGSSPATATNGVGSLTGKVSDCESDGCQFEPGPTPQVLSPSLAQWTRASRYDRECRGFESLTTVQCLVSSIGRAGASKAQGLRFDSVTGRQADVAEWSNAEVCKTSQP